MWDSVVQKINGKDLVESLSIKNVKTNDSYELSVDGIFPYIGIVPNVEFFNGQIEQDSKGFIITNNTMETSINGVYAIGDVRNTPLRQVVTAASDGAVAGVYASKYVQALHEVKI